MWRVRGTQESLYSFSGAFLLITRFKKKSCVPSCKILYLFSLKTKSPAESLAQNGSSRNTRGTKENEQTRVWKPNWSPGCVDLVLNSLASCRSAWGRPWPCPQLRNGCPIGATPPRGGGSYPGWASLPSATATSNHCPIWSFVLKMVALGHSFWLVGIKFGMMASLFFFSWPTSSELLVSHSSWHTNSHINLNLRDGVWWACHLRLKSLEAQG